LKKILIFKSDKVFTKEQYKELSDYIQCQYENNKPIIVPNDVKYELVECSESQQVYIV